MNRVAFLGLIIVTIFFGGACTENGQDKKSGTNLQGYHGKLDTNRFSFEGQFSAELPWEVKSERSEFYLMDIFYADDIQNEQLMPLAVQDGAFKYEIKQLIYPTIGNPNLFVKGGKDSLSTVLRLKPELFKHLELKTQARKGERLKKNPHLDAVTFDKSDAKNRFNFFLMRRKERKDIGRKSALKYSGIALSPEQILKISNKDMPPAFQTRDTLEFIFREAALGGVKPGLYDLRYELIRDGKLVGSEYQYNAVRIYPAGADSGKYNVINMTDSQVSISEFLDGIANKQTFKAISHDKLKSFVKFVNTSTSPKIRNAAFITFNGDLHNGGSPGTLMPSEVAHTYNREAAAILRILKSLTVPIFLTPGNHDGYASTGHVPGPINKARFLEKKSADSLEKTVTKAVGEAPWKTLSAFLKETKKLPGGRHLDIFSGAFIRRGRVGKGKKLFWQKVPKKHRNMMLYDGFNQWRKTYGPLAFSWDFGKNHYISLNTYNLRQHRRSGWGMYTVNYGGGISSFQMNWIRRDIYSNEKKDIVIVAHHDPRGGHNGKDYPYYFKQITYRGMGDSAVNYVNGEILNPMLCGKVPGWAKSQKYALNCMHDGLQEWMRPDKEFDCHNDALLESGPRAGQCDVKSFKSTTYEGNLKHPDYSGYILLHRLAKHKGIRTMLLGHTHYHSIEILQPGQELVPAEVILDYKADKKYARIEVDNPMRAKSYDDKEKVGKLAKLSYKKKDGRKVLTVNLIKSGHNFQRILNEHELVILRLTSISNLSIQLSLDGGPMYGFTVFEVNKHADSRKYDKPQLNSLDYFQSQGDGFKYLKNIQLDRSKTWKSAGRENPLQKLFTMGKTKKKEEPK